MKYSLSATLALTMALAMSSISTVRSANEVVHVEILGVDAPALQKFYEDLFGWKAKLNPIGYGYVPVAPTAPIALSGGIGPNPEKKPLVTFYVKVDDPAATLKRATELGGKIVMPPVDVPGDITFARFTDPEGNVVGLVRRPE